MDMSAGIVERRRRDSIDRVKTFSRYADLNNLCDIGAGDGSFLVALNSMNYTGCFGVDPNVRAVQWAKERGADVLCGRVDTLSSLLQGRQVSCFSLLQLLEHLQNPVTAIRELYAQLPPGGSLIIETVNFRSPTVQKSLAFISKYHHVYLDENTLSALVTKVGFHIVARGRRDFDRHHLGNAEALRRLGILPIKKRPIKEVSQQKDPVSTFASVEHIPRVCPIRFFFDRVLSDIVSVLGRTDYIWMVAKKD